MKKTAQILLFPAAFLLVGAWFILTWINKKLYNFYSPPGSISYREYLEIYVLDEI